MAGEANAILDAFAFLTDLATKRSLVLLVSFCGLFCEIVNVLDDANRGNRAPDGRHEHAALGHQFTNEI